MPSMGSPTFGAVTKLAMASYPVLSCGPTCGQNGYVTPAISGGPNGQSWNNVKNGYVTLADSGAHMWANLLYHDSHVWGLLCLAQGQIGNGA